ncbi:hypothetical protein Emag_006100 [Eimeria magna]
MTMTHPLPTAAAVAAAPAAAAPMRGCAWLCPLSLELTPVGAVELQQRSSSSSNKSSTSRWGSLCEYLPVVVMLVGADVEDHRLAVRMLQLELQHQTKCCCGGRRSSRNARTSNSSSSVKEELFCRQVVLRANQCTNMQAALRAVFVQLKGSSCCGSCVGRSSSSKAEAGNPSGAAAAEELAADAAAAAAWGEPAAFCTQQQQQLLLQCLEGGEEEGSAAAAGAAVDEEEAGSLGFDLSRRIGQLWKKQLQEHQRGFCCTWRFSGETAAVRTRRQQQQWAASHADSDSHSSNASFSDDNSDHEASSALNGSSSSDSSGRNRGTKWGSPNALVIVLEELEAFAPRMLSQLLLLLAMLRNQQGIPVVVLASAAASAAAVQQQLDPATLRLLQLDAAVLLRPSAIHDALLQLLLCCPASTPFVLPAAAIEELQQLLLDQGTSVLQLVRVLRLLLYKYFAEHPFSFLSVDARALLKSSSSSNNNGSSNNTSNNSRHASAACSVDLSALQRRIALLAAATLSEPQQEALLQQLKKFPLLHAELCAAISRDKPGSTCSSSKASTQQRQQAGGVAAVFAVLQQWWHCPGIRVAAAAEQPVESRSKALQQQLLPAAAVQLLERRVGASVAMRLLVVLQQHVLQQRQAFALNAEESAAATAASAAAASSSSAMPAVTLMLEILSSGRAQGFHDYLLQGSALSPAAAPRTVSLICEEARRVAAACSRVGGLVTALVAEALSAAANTGHPAAVPQALLLALQQFSSQARREWALLLQLETFMQQRQQEQQLQQAAQGGRAHELFSEMNNLLESLHLICQQQQQQQEERRRVSQGGFVSGLGRRASAAALSLDRRPINSSSSSTSNISENFSGVSNRFRVWARDCLVHLLLPLPQWHPLGCELAVWALSFSAAELPQCLAAALAAPRPPLHRAEAAAADALARMQPLQPLEVLQQLACLSNSALEYQQQAAEAAAAPAAGGNREVSGGPPAVEDTGLLYRRLAFGSRRILLWDLFCCFCSDLIEACIQQRPHLRKQQQERQQQQEQVLRVKKGKSYRGNNSSLTEEEKQEEERRRARLALELRALQEIETETDSGGSPSSVLHHFFLRFGVALCSLEHLGLIRLPTAAASAQDLLLRAAAADELASVAEQEALESPTTSDDEEGSPFAAAAASDEQEQQHQRALGKNSVLTKRKRRARRKGEGAPCPEALQLQQQLEGLYLTRCFFGSVFLPQAQKHDETPQRDSNTATLEPRK